MTEMMQATGMSRRKFMAWAGGAAGLAAMAAMGISAGRGECSVNIPEIDPETVTTAESGTDVLVVGSGIAGLRDMVRINAYQDALQLFGTPLP